MLRALQVLLIVAWGGSVYMYIPLFVTTTLMIVLPVGLLMSLGVGLYDLVLADGRVEKWVQGTMVGAGKVTMYVGALEILVLILLLMSVR